MMRSQESEVVNLSCWGRWEEPCGCGVGGVGVREGERVSALPAHAPLPGPLFCRPRQHPGARRGLGGPQAMGRF